jgi:N-acetylglucosamine malate deacetylase 1
MMDEVVGREAKYRRWLEFVARFAEALALERALPAESSMDCKPVGPPTEPPPRPLQVLLCSPHPDDEALVGALPLRLRIEAGVDVVNCAVTLGSKKSARPRRLAELQRSCEVLGFRLRVPDYPNGLNSVNRSTAETDPATWAENVRLIKELIEAEQPNIIFLPHEKDFHPTHVGTHYLILDALRCITARETGPVMLIETEYWHQVENPNLMVGVAVKDEATLVMAIAEHGGEVARNPYHARHPARLIDNVRRGSEVVGAPGDAACDFTFAEIYRVGFVHNGAAVKPWSQGKILSPGERAQTSTLFAAFQANPDGTAAAGRNRH